MDFARNMTSASCGPSSDDTCKPKHVLCFAKMKCAPKDLEGGTKYDRIVTNAL